MKTTNKLLIIYFIICYCLGTYWVQLGSQGLYFVPCHVEICVGMKSLDFGKRQIPSILKPIFKQFLKNKKINW